MDEIKSIEQRINEIKETVGSERAISALSGGVDSSACTVLAHRALGSNLKVVFIDDGLMREKEPEQVREVFRDLGIEVDIIDVHDEFFQALKGKIDPEEKRKAFRSIFYTIFGREVLKSEAKFLVQGAFAVLLSDKGTGVEEGKRKFGEIVIVRSVESKDAMTAEPTQVPWEVLMKISKRMTGEIPEVVRVAYEITPKPPATIEYI
jgi:GMP synthase (glutamine-hydrolysing)